MPDPQPTYSTGDRVTVAAYATSRAGHDAHGQVGTVTAVPRGYGRYGQLYAVQVPGWDTPALLAAEELRPATDPGLRLAPEQPHPVTRGACPPNGGHDTQRILNLQ